MKRALGLLVVPVVVVAAACSSSSSDDATDGTPETPPGVTPTGDGSTTTPPGPGEEAGVDATMPDAVDAGCVRPNPASTGDGDFEIGPTYTNAPELTPKAGVPRGTIIDFEMSSKTSKIYPGLNGPYTRKVSVYVPKQYVDGTAAPFMVVQDGQGYVASLTPVLDSMIADKRLPPIIAILIASGGGDGRGSERGLEYDRVSDDYSNFIETEVLPIIPKNADVLKTWKNLRFTKDPEGRATMGGSSGGSCAFTMAWFHPERYRRVLTYSGTFVNQHPEPAYPASGWEYHSHLINDAAPKPIRVTLEVGENDNNLDAAFKDGQHNWITANRAMAKVLKAKGYHYRFEFAKAAGHVDPKVRAQTLPSALEWLWRGYTACPAEP